MANYSIREYADTHFIYGFTNGNGAQAAEEYARRYPGRKHFGECKENSFRKEIMPLLVLYRTLGRFPFHVNENGRLEVKYYSLQGFYFFLIYGLVSTLWLDTLTSDDLREHLVDDSFSKKVSAMAGILSYGIHFSVLFPFLGGWKSLAGYVNEWDQFEAYFVEVMGAPYEFKYAKLIAWVAVVLPIAAIFVVLFLLPTLLFAKTWYQLLPTAIVITGSTIEYGFFALSCLELASISSMVNHKLKQVIESDRATASELQAMRLLWVEMSSIIRKTGSCLAMPLFLDLGAATAIFSIAAFGGLSGMLTGNFDVSQYIVTLITAWMRLFFCFESGYFLTHSAGARIVRTISTSTLANMDNDAVDEYEIFLQAIKIDYPSVTIGGFVDVSRSTLSSVMSAATLYIMVMIQLQASQRDA